MAAVAARSAADGAPGRRPSSANERTRRSAAWRQSPRTPAKPDEEDAKSGRAPRRRIGRALCRECLLAARNDRARGHDTAERGARAGASRRGVRGGERTHWRSPAGGRLPAKKSSSRAAHLRSPPILQGDPPGGFGNPFLNSSLSCGYNRPTSLASAALSFLLAFWRAVQAQLFGPLLPHVPDHNRRAGDVEDKDDDQKNVIIKGKIGRIWQAD